jgi:hypothetical protein
MEALDVALPPGFFGCGTKGQSRGRWLEGNLTRFEDRQLAPWRGWRDKAATLVTGRARAMLPWRTDEQLSWCAIGTHTGLFVMGESTAVFDVTPTGFTPGRPDAVAQSGFGRGAYGQGAYGAPRASTTSIQPASMHTLDTWGQDLVGVMAEDGRPYQWRRDPAVRAAFIPGAPVCKALLVTPERAQMHLAAGGNNRRVRWSHWENNTLYAADATTKAGEQDLQTGGELMCGRPVRGRSLILSTQDAWLAEKRAGLLVYQFDKIGDGCGVVSRGALVVLGDSRAMWMGPMRFWVFDGGFVKPVQSEVADRVFTTINGSQASKVTAVHDSALGAVRWYYPTSASLENDSYVEFDYVNGDWTDGRIIRLAATDRGAFEYPLGVDASGRIHEHEVGAQYGGATPFARALVRLGEGQRRLTARYLIPDERVLGDVEVFARARAELMSPTAQESGPYRLQPRTPVRFTGREVELEFRFARPDPDSRVGDFRLLCQPRGER